MRHCRTSVNKSQASGYVPPLQKKWLCVQAFLCRGRDHEWLGEGKIVLPKSTSMIWFRKARCPFSLNRWPQQMELVEEAPKCLLEQQFMMNKWKTAECSDSVPNFYCLVWKPQISSFLLFFSLRLSCFESLAICDTQMRPQASVKLPFSRAMPVLLTELAASTLLSLAYSYAEISLPNLEDLWASADKLKCSRFSLQ